MSTEMHNDLENFLEEYNIPYEIITFCRALPSLSKAANALGIKKNQLLKIYLLKKHQPNMPQQRNKYNSKHKQDSRYLGAILPGDKIINEKKYSYISSTSPMYLIKNNINTIFDGDLLNHDLVHILSRDFTLGYDIDPKDLQTALINILIEEEEGFEDNID